MKRNNKRFRMMDLSSLGRQNDGLEDGVAEKSLSEIHLSGCSVG